MKNFILIGLLSILSSCSTNSYKLSSASADIANLGRSIQISIIDEQDYYVFYGTNQPAHDKIVFFIHGFGAINPAIYGKWIKQLIGIGCAVIYPRYQKSTKKPRPAEFSETMSNGMLNGINHIKSLEGVVEDNPNVYYFGHSYGGAACLYFGIEYKKYGLPKAKGIFACQPGTGNSKAMAMAEYSAMEKDIDLVVLSSEHDNIVGHERAKIAYNTAKVENNVWIEQFGYEFDSIEFKADHGSPCNIDLEFDNNKHNLVYKLALKKSNFDIEDKEIYFNISEELLKVNKEREWLYNIDKASKHINILANSMGFVPFEYHSKLVK